MVWAAQQTAEHADGIAVVVGGERASDKNTIEMSHTTGITVEGFLAIARHLMERIQRLEERERVELVCPAVTTSSTTTISRPVPRRRPTARPVKAAAVIPPPEETEKSTPPRMPPPPQMTAERAALEVFWIGLCQSRKLSTVGAVEALTSLLGKRNWDRVEENASRIVD